MDISYDFFCSNHSYMLGSFAFSEKHHLEIKRSQPVMRLFIHGSHGIFKDVLSGNQSLTYTMTKGLGGSAIGIFSYYLASPTELLQLFFQKTKCLFHIIWQLSLNGNGIIDDDMVLAGPIQ